MSHEYLTKIGTKKTPQSEPIIGSSQVPNSAGGYVWELDIWGKLDRWLILGSETGTYYISSPKLTRDNADVLMRCIKEDGVRVVNKIVEVSIEGRAPKNDPAIFALAMCFAADDVNTRRAAADALTKVCRIGTHLFHFAQFVEQFRGWGKLLKKAVAGWYENMPTDRLAYQVVKYRQRDGWSHRDLLRLSHPTGDNNAIFDWVAGKDNTARGNSAVVSYNIIRGYELVQQKSVIIEGQESELKNATKVMGDKAVARLVTDYNLPREALPTEALKSKEVWEALLEKMPMTAMIRNLGNMSKIGLLTNLSDASKTVIERLGNQELITKARVHPIQILSALTTYANGGGYLGRGTWIPVAQVVDALDKAFYLSFGNVEPTGKNIMLALDVSGSMVVEMQNIPGLSARSASAAMALITAATEPNHMFTAFASAGVNRYRGRWGSIYGSGGRTSDNPDDGMVQITVSPRQRLDDVVKSVSNMPFGGTDCSLPMMYALKHDLDIDAFVVYTDSETWAGTIHPTQALRQYREKTGINAKLIVVGLTSSGFTIADPTDAGMLDVVGFDTAAPSVMSEFIK